MNDDWDDSDLEEAAPEDGDPAGSVEIHQLEDEGPTLGDHGDSQQEEDNAETDGELPSDGSEVEILISVKKRKNVLHLSLSGHISTIPVTRLSTRQNSLSIPMI